MANENDRKDELFAIALAARRKDSKAGLQGAQKGPNSTVPTPEEDHQTDFVRNMSPKQRALYRQLLESD